MISCLLVLHVSAQSFFFPQIQLLQEKPCSLNPLSPQGRIQHSKFSQDRACSFGTSKIFLSERVEVMRLMKEPERALKSLMLWKSLFSLFNLIVCTAKTGLKKFGKYEGLYCILSLLCDFISATHRHFCIASLHSWSGAAPGMNSMLQLHEVLVFC